MRTVREESRENVSWRGNKVDKLERTESSAWQRRRKKKKKHMLVGCWQTKNASSSELRDEDASCSEYRGSQLVGVDSSICPSGSLVCAQ